MKLRLLTLYKVMRNELVMKTLPGAALWIYVLSYKRNIPPHTVGQGSGVNRGKEKKGEGEKD